MSFKRTAVTAAAVCLSLHALNAQEVRRAIPVAPAATTPKPEPPVAPAVPFDFDKITPTPTPAPRVAPTPVPGAVMPAPTPVVAETPVPVAPETADKQQLDYGNAFYAKKMYDMAIPEYEKYLSLYPGGPDLQTVYFRLAESYRAAGSLNNAKKNYELLLTTFTNGEFIGPASYRLGDLYFQEKNYEMALPMFRRASVRLTDKALVNSSKFFMARSLEGMNSVAEAQQIYTELAAATDNNPFREPSRLALARLLTDAGKKVEAHKQYELLAKETEKPEIRIEALVKASLLKIDLGENDKAAADLQRALQQPDIGPWKDVARMGLLHAFYEGAKYKELVDYYTANTKDFSTDILPEALLLVGNSQRKLGNSKAALPVYDQVVKKYPDSTYAKEAQYQRLVALYYAEDPALVKDIDDYLAQNPGSDKRAQIILLKAESFYRKQKYAEAVPVYASLQGAGLPEDLNADAEFKLGWCQMQVRDYPNAVKAFSDFLTAYPKNKLVPSALVQRAVAYQKTGDTASAMKDFDQIINSFPKAKERELALQQKALIYGQRGDNQSMSETFQKLLKEYPQTTGAAQANYWIGSASFYAKKYKDAIPSLDAARKGDKEQFFEKATLLIMTSLLDLEDRDKLAAEVDAYPKTGTKIKIPAQMLRWLGAQYLNDKNYEQAEKYLTQLTSHAEDATPDDWLDLGHALANQHRDEEAVKAFSKYLESAKDPIPRCVGLLALSDAQLSLGKYDDAQKSAAEACSLQPEGKLNAEGRILSAEILVARGQFENGAKLFLTVPVMLDDPVVTPHAMELAIDAYKKAGKEAEAAKVLNDLQTRYSEYVQQKKNAAK